MTADTPSASPSLSTVSTESMVQITRNENAPHRDQLLWSKSKVYVHPTAYARDNIAGFVALTKRDGLNPTYLLAWIPETLLDAKGKDEWAKFTKVEAKPADLDDDIVLVDLPSRGESYAFSVPLTSVYSLIVHPPSLSSWYGSIGINLVDGLNLPTLHFHDDESRSLTLGETAHSWGGEDLLQRLRQYANLLRSSLQPSLFLVDPSRQDIETHSMLLFNDDSVDNILHASSPVPAHRRPRPQSMSIPASQDGERSRGHARRNSILHQTFAPLAPASTGSQARSALMLGFSNITRATRHAAQNILSHPLARPILPHLPDPVKSLVNANGEWSSWVEKGGVGEFEHVYIARLGISIDGFCCQAALRARVSTAHAACCDGQKNEASRHGFQTSSRHGLPWGRGLFAASRRYLQDFARTSPPPHRARTATLHMSKSPFDKSVPSLSPQKISSASVVRSRPRHGNQRSGFESPSSQSQNVLVRWMSPLRCLSRAALEKHYPNLSTIAISS